MSNDTIVWEDPPQRSYQTNFDTIKEQLDERPGEWARIRTYKSAKSAGSAAGYLRKRHPGYEFASRSVDNQGYVYARTPETVKKARGKK